MPIHGVKTAHFICASTGLSVISPRKYGRFADLVANRSRPEGASTLVLGVLIEELQ